MSIGVAASLFAGRRLPRFSASTPRSGHSAAQVNTLNSHEFYPVNLCSPCGEGLALRFSRLGNPFTLKREELLPDTSCPLWSIGFYPRKATECPVLFIAPPFLILFLVRSTLAQYCSCMARLSVFSMLPSLINVTSITSQPAIQSVVFTLEQRSRFLRWKPTQRG